MIGQCSWPMMARPDFRRRLVGVSERRSTLHPFLSSTFSNTSIGSGIVTDPASAKNATLQAHGTDINSEDWSIPVYEASASDPEYTFSDNESEVITLRIPDVAEPAIGTDRHISVTQPNRQVNVEMWGATKTGSPGSYVWDANTAHVGDLLSDGRDWGARASGISHLHGLIRAEEVAVLRIPHSLALGIRNDQLQSGFVWPAKSQDGDHATAYSGNIPMGSMFAIPISVNINSLGLSAAGVALAWTLQNYGCHVLIRSGSNALYAEPDAYTQFSATITAMRTAWASLMPLLEYVTNNTSNNVAGGGARLQSPLPEVVAR
jgi:hypothetical protein